jgi:hypothetical protein
MNAGTRPHVDDVVGGADHVLVVLDHQHAVANVAQMLERADQPVVVALVQADAGRRAQITPVRPEPICERPAGCVATAARQRLGAAVQAQ